MAEIEPQSIEELEAAAEEYEALVAAGLVLIAAEVARQIANGTLSSLSVAAVDTITALWNAYVEETLLPALTLSMISAGDEVGRSLTAVLGDLPFLSEPLDTQLYLAQAQNRLVGIGNALWFNARAAIAQGIAEGEEIPKIAARVRDAAGVTEPRARTIARTESHGARNTVNAASVRRVATAFGSGSAFTRRWQAAEDERTRETHVIADGQTVALNEPFSVGGASLDFPGDPAGPPSEVINCRCTTITLIDVDALNRTATPDTITLTAAAEHTGAMIALAPTEEDAKRLAVDGYEDVEELHLTLAYLGEGADWSPEQRDTLMSALISAAASAPGPIEGDAFGVNHWNPNGDEPCWVLGVGGDGLADLHSSVWEALSAVNGPTPDNHTPWIPHVCLAYATGTDLFDEFVSRTGPITFDRLRVAFAGENTYLPLGASTSDADFQEDAVMPWSIVEGDERCDAGEFAVVKDADLELEGCHGTREEAEAQIAALNASESEDDADSAALPTSMRNTVPWSGVLVVEGTPTGDGRQFAAGSLTWPALGETASLEIPLGWMYERAHGGMATDKVVNVGRIDTITRSGNELLGTGVLNLDTEWGRRAAEQMGTRDDPGFLAGVSIDADDPSDPRGLNVEYVFPDSCELEEADDAGTLLDDNDGPEDDIAAEMACMIPEMEIYHSGRIRAATLVDIPAYVEARLYLDQPVPEGTPVEGETVSMPIVASSFTMEIPDLPPVEWFDEPTDEPEIGAITVTDEGRFFGYLAPKNVAHRGIRDKRVTVPMGNVDYGVWMNRVTIADDGRGGFTRVATGPITMDCGHASASPRVVGAARREHYDNSCSIVATVRVGENARGVWIAGAVLPDVTPDQIRRMMACQLSGDWGPHREKPGKRELAGALLVPVPGFPKRSNGFMSMKGGQLDRVTVPLRFGRVVKSQTISFGVDAAAARIAASIGRDPESRVRAFAARRQVQH